MKKSIIITFSVTFLALSGIAKAGNSIEMPVVSNGKNEVGVKGSKTQSKYTFTLFSFFTTGDKSSKSDTSGTILKTPIRKEEKIN